MTYHVYDGRRVIYETLDEARIAAQAAIDEYRKQATIYEWPDTVSEIAVYEAPDDCGEPWRDGTLVLEARERVIEDEDHPLGRYSEFDLVEVIPASDPVPVLVAEYARSAPETVEVWSSDPAVNGTTMIVSTTPEPESFELIVADCLPDDDDGGEEPGAMYRRALAKAKARVDLIRQVAILVSGADDAEDFERTYRDEEQREIRWTAREIIQLVRATPATDTITLGQTLALVRERIEGVLQAPHYAEEVLPLAIADIDGVIDGNGAAR